MFLSLMTFSFRSFSELFVSFGFLMWTVLIVNFEEDMIGHWIIDFPLCHVILCCV